MKEVLLTNGKLTIKESGEYLFKAESDTETLIEYLSDQPLKVDLKVEVGKASHTTLVFLNHTTNSLETKEEFRIAGYAQFGYLELSGHPAKHHIRSYLTSEGAYSDIHTASVADNNLDYDIETIHEKPHTTGLMENYGIVVKQVPWTIVCAGRINKYSVGAQSKQTTRILTFVQPELIKVLPILYIDEDDVIASHATSLGQPDADELYYMESRGLNRDQAIGLLTIGYLMPIAKLPDDKSYQKLIAQEITKKVTSWKI